MPNDPACPPAHRALAIALVHALTTQHALGARAERSVLTVAGESGSGKSITALCLASALNAEGIPTTVLHQDDYFHRPPATNHAYRVANLESVGPQEVNMALLSGHVAAFREGVAVVTVPTVDYEADRFVPQQRSFAACSVLIVEGTYVLAHVEADVGIFLQATSDDTRERRRLRNRDIDAPIVEQVLAIEHPIIARQAERADILIDRDFHIVLSHRRPG